MSGQIKLKHASGNGVIIAAPSSNPAADRTLTLPSDADGVIAKTDASGNLTVEGNLNTSNINGGQLGYTRLTINGGMTIAQRGTSSTANNYGTVDRYECSFLGTDEAPTQAQVDVSSSDTPYTLGLTKAFKITNGNQSSGAGATDYIRIRHRIEAQDIRNSGWNYKSPSSYITISFWVKSSVAQTFYFTVRTYDGTAYYYPIPFSGTTSWTKVTHSIAGNSNLDFDNDANLGFELQWAMFFGTDYTDNSIADNTWATFNGNNQTKDHTSTWYTTNNATFELTGVQLEVGPTATAFQFNTPAQELLLCQRYYFGGADTSSGNAYYGGVYSTGNSMVKIYLPVFMRAVPTVTNPTHGGGGTLNSIYENTHAIHYYITSDTSVYVPRGDVKCDAEL